MLITRPLVGHSHCFGSEVETAGLDFGDEGAETAGFVGAGLVSTGAGAGRFEADERTGTSSDFALPGGGFPLVSTVDPVPVERVAC